MSQGEVLFRTNEDSPPSIAWQKAYDYVGGSNVIYEGWAFAGAATSDAAWVIRMYTYSGSNVVAMQYANGDVENNKVWDNRASGAYVYS